MALASVRGIDGAPRLEEWRLDQGLAGVLPSPDLHLSFDAPSVMLPPADIEPAPSLERLLLAQHIEGWLLESMMPLLRNRALFLTPRFQAALIEARTALSDGQEQADGMPPRASAETVRAILDQEIALRRLLRTFRNALLQG